MINTAIAAQSAVATTGDPYFNLKFFDQSKLSYRHRSIEGHPFTTFYDIGEGNFGWVAAGFYEGKAVAFKIAKPGGASEDMLRREVLLTEYFNHAGIRCARVLKYSPKDRIAIKELIPGSTPLELKALHQSGQITDQQYREARQKAQLIVEKVQSIAYTRDCQKFCQKHFIGGAFFDVDTESNSMRYYNGEWILIDP